MTLKGQKKGRMPRRMARERTGRQRCDLPPGLRRAGLRGCRNMVEHQRGARGFCRQCEATARGEIEQPRIAPEFNHDSTEAGAARAFQPGLQHSGGIARLNEDQARRRHTKGGETRRIGDPGFPVEHRVTNPEHRALPRGDPGRCQRKSGCRRAIGLSCGMEIEVGRNTAFRVQEGRQHSVLVSLWQRHGQRRDKGNVGKGERDRHIKCSYFVLLN